MTNKCFTNTITRQDSFSNTSKLSSRLATIQQDGKREHTAYLPYKKSARFHDKNEKIVLPLTKTPKTWSLKKNFGTGKKVEGTLTTLHPFFIVSRCLS